MSKAILVIDMPKNCEECRLMNEHYDNDYGWQTYCGADYHRIKEKNKKYFCPLKPLPKKDNCKIPYISNRIKLSDGEEVAYYMGFNACLDEILGEKIDE